MTSTASLTSRKPRVVHDADRIDWTNGGLFVLCAILALGWVTDHDNADFWRKEAERANAEVERRNNLESLPNPAIVLDARTAEKFGIRLADIAGGLDGARAELMGKK